MNTNLLYFQLTLVPENKTKSWGVSYTWVRLHETVRYCQSKEKCSNTFHPLLRTCVLSEKWKRFRAFVTDNGRVTFKQDLQNGVPFVANGLHFCQQQHVPLCSEADRLCSPQQKKQAPLEFLHARDLREGCATPGSKIRVEDPLDENTRVSGWRSWVLAPQGTSNGFTTNLTWCNLSMSFVSQTFHVHYVWHQLRHANLPIHAPTRWNNHQHDTLTFSFCWV